MYLALWFVLPSLIFAGKVGACQKRPLRRIDLPAKIRLAWERWTETETKPTSLLNCRAKIAVTGFIIQLTSLNFY